MNSKMGDRCEKYIQLPTDFCSPSLDSFSKTGIRRLVRIDYDYAYKLKKGSNG